MNGKAKPRQASTVILLREGAVNGFEVFLTRRPDGMPFLGGMYCFPGGAVTKDDCSPPLLERCRGLTPQQARKIMGAHFNPRQAAGFWTAAVRELFEEVGILLAVDSCGAPVSPRAASEIHRVMRDKASRFLCLLQQEDLYCDLSSLAYVSHWQTPSENPLRFDTRFFVAALPRHQTPLETSAEVTHSLWLTPERAMQRSARGDLPIIFPTFATLRTLADFATIESVMKEFSTSARNPARPTS